MEFRTVNLDTDAAAIIRLKSLTRPDPITEAQIREWWQPSEGQITFNRLALSDSGQAVGLLDMWRDHWMPAGEYRADLIVAPERRGQGLGGQMLALGMEWARDQGGTCLIGNVRDNDPQSQVFLQRRGFEVIGHTFESLLDLHAFDESSFTTKRERVIASGVRLFSLAQAQEPVGAEARAAMERRLYELNRTNGLDIPGGDGTFAAYEDFRRFVFEASWYRAEGQFLAAVDTPQGEKWVGLGAVGYFSDGNYAYNMHTGVLREYRGRGIAQALKLAGIRWAQSLGADYIRTHNNEKNLPMLAVNRKFGYRPEPGLVQMETKIVNERPGRT